MSKKLLLGLLLGLLVVGSLSLFGCSSATQVSATLGRITGTIVAADGTSPIGGASVYLKTDSTKSTTTSYDGSFTLEGSWIITGTYTLVATKGGFTLEFSVTVASSEATTNVGTKEVDRGRLRRPIARDRRYEPSIAKRRPHQNAHRPRERCVGDHRDRRDPRRRGGRFRPLTARREHEGSHEDCPENPAPHGTPLVVRYPVNRSSSEMDATLTIHTYYTRY